MTYVELAVLERRVLRPSRARDWAHIYNKIRTNHNSQATVHNTWYGAKAIVWLRKDCVS
jgi:hypothetical protein